MNETWNTKEREKRDVLSMREKRGGKRTEEMKVQEMTGEEKAR